MLINVDDGVIDVDVFFLDYIIFFEFVISLLLSSGYFFIFGFFGGLEFFEYLVRVIIDGDFLLNVVGWLR